MLPENSENIERKTQTEGETLFVQGLDKSLQLFKRARPIYRQGVIPDFTLPDTLGKNFVRDLVSKSSKFAETL